MRDIKTKKLGPTAFVILGITGDLAQRSLLPALFDLYSHGLTPRSFSIIGIGHSKRTKAQLISLVKKAIREHSENKKITATQLERFCKKVSYTQLDLTDPAQAQKLETILDEEDDRITGDLVRIIYNSLPPHITRKVLIALKACSFDKYCAKHLPRTRIVVEKPFGSDLASAQYLNALLKETFYEKQIYRIDHYLGKEALQDILVFRFGNTIVEPLLNKHFVDNIQVTVAESSTIGSRAGYYDHSGALRDMVVNHLTQILTHTIMEMPESLSAQDLRGARGATMRKLRVAQSGGAYKSVRGQYAGYKAEKGVKRGSNTETFVVVELQCSAPRWKGVPMYLRSGKGMSEKVAAVTIEFKRQACSFIPENLLAENTLTLRLQPEPGITTKINTKRPSFHFEIEKTQMDFMYSDHYETVHPGAYEKLFVEIFKGEQEHFRTPEEVEAQWKLYEPLIKEWRRMRKPHVLPYKKGTWGPARASSLLKNSKNPTRHWHAENI